MTKKETIILFSILFLIGISIAIPAFLWFRTYFNTIDAPIDSEKLADLATFQSFIVSFWALLLNAVVVYFAYKAFKHFGVKEQFHQKQFELVCQLSSDISNTDLRTVLYRKNEDFNPKYTFNYYNLFEIDYLNHVDVVLVYENYTEQIFTFLKHKSNPLLPKKLADILRKLSKRQGTEILDFNLLSVKNVLTLSNTNNSVDINEDVLMVYSNNPVELRANVISLKKEIQSWLKKYGADDINI